MSDRICKCGRKLVLEVDRIRGICFSCCTNKDPKPDRQEVSATSRLKKTLYRRTHRTLNESLSLLEQICELKDGSSDHMIAEKALRDLQSVEVRLRKAESRLHD